MFFLFMLLVTGIIIYFSERGEWQKRIQRLNDQLLEAKQQQTELITKYQKEAKSKAEKALLAKMLADVKGEQLVAEPELAALSHAEAAVASAAVATAPDYALAKEPDTIIAPQKQAAQLDNASLLLYFGAFLFVASAGLFVAFGNATGGLKTFIVLLVTAVMYASGVWLYRNRPKLQQAGQAFAGIGVVLAPLVGAALYAYVFNQEQGALVWFITSLFCMGLYAHALTTFKTTLMGYVLVFTFLSLFESGIGIVDAPVYYYGWGLALVAILLQLGYQWRGWWKELYTPSRQSAQIFLPLSLLVALWATPELGALQLGVSLVLAAVFYSLEAWRTSGKEREANAVVSQVTAMMAAGALTYGLTHEWSTAVTVVTVAVVIQLGVVLMQKDAMTRLWQNFGSVLLVASIVNAVAAVAYPKLLLSTAVVTVLVGGALWVKQRRADAYGVGALALSVVPYIFGQLVLDNFPPVSQAMIGLAALLLLLIAHIEAPAWLRTLPQWSDFANVTFALGATGVMITSIFTSPIACLAISLAVAVTLITLAEAEKQADWAEAAALLMVVPMLRNVGDEPVFLLTTLIVLTVLVLLTLRYRRELLRWSSTIVWLVLPFAIGHGGLGQYWPAAGYAWGYVVAMLGLIVSRAIARGVVFLSTKVAVHSLSRKASNAYVTGYIVAAFIAVFTSFTTPNSRLHTSLILAILIGAVLFLGKYVEKRQDILAFLPYLSQALLLSAMRPPQEGQMLMVYVVLSTTLALITYAEFYNKLATHPALKPAAQSALWTAFIAPLAAFVAPTTWAMPVGLLVAGGMLLHYNWLSKQENREWSVAVMVLAVMWFVGWAGVRELQAYTHIIVAALGGFAYWRYRLGQLKESDNYLWAMLATATIPLALQAIGSEAGGTYGWLLLLEQVAIMLLGMSIKRPFVTRWGLYVAVGAVLYQLRHLGYAALAVLALFLIGLAVYRLQKTPKD